MQALEAILPGSRVSSGSDTTQAAREFEELLTDGATLAFRVAMGVLHNRADAEEVAQETLLRAYRSFKGLRERGAFRGWLCRIAWRLALDPGWTFIRTYFIQRGFLDGPQGFTLARMAALYTFRKYSKAR